MSQKPRPNPPDLTQDWPDNPANDDLARLGQELFAQSPGLSPLALDRIQIRMRQEMNRPWWSRHLKTILVCLIGLAALSLAIRGYLRHAPSNSATPSNTTNTINPPAIRDTYEVTLPPSTPTAPQKPLIDTNQYNNLFKPEKKEAKP